MKVDLADFKKLLNVPESYQASDLDKRVLKPVMNELPSIFKGLKVHKIKSRRRGNQLLGYEFTFQKESTHNWIDDKYDKSGNAKKHQLAVKYLTGMTLIIKTKLLQKAKKSLKELSKNL